MGAPTGGGPATVRAVRVLLGCSMGGLGHLTPIVTVARALQRGGHDTLIVAPPGLATAGAADTGLAFRAGGEPPEAVTQGIWRRVEAGPPEEVAGLIDRELFAGLALDAMLPTMQQVAEEWRPDWVIREPCEWSSAVVAADREIPQAQVAISLATIEAGVLDMVAPRLDHYHSGLAAQLRERPYLSRFPASLDPSSWPLTVRFHEPAAPARPLPDWWPGDDRPLVYLTFGTVTAHTPVAQAAYRVATDAAAAMDARVLLTVGRVFDAAQLGPLPDNLHIEAWVPQTDVLAVADAVVGHGGSGTTFGALAAGVPQVVVPLFADQPRNGALVEAAGAGVVVGGASGGVRTLEPGDAVRIAEAVAEVLASPAYRHGAGRVAAEMAATPTVDAVVDELLGAAQ